MTISEALGCVSKVYVPGVVKYYSGMNPDPWQRAHEELEKIVCIKDDLLKTTALARFVTRSSELVDRFKKESTIIDCEASPADAFAIGDLARVKQFQSIRYRECVRCNSKKDLVIMKCGEDEMQAQIMCRPCMKDVYNK